MKNNQTFSEALEDQLAIMRAAAQSIEKRGYAVLVHNCYGPDMAEPFGFGYLNGGFSKFTYTWARTNRSRHLIIDVVYNRVRERPTRWREVFDKPFSFQLHIPNLKVYAPIFAVLELMAIQVKDNRGGKRLHYDKATSYTSVRGEDKDQLDVLLKILNMPQHRAILTGSKERKAP